MGKLSNAAGFFASVNASLFAGKMAQSQVKGLAAILSAAVGMSLGEVSYALATAYHETGRSIAPNRENLNYSASALIALYPRRISAADAELYGRTTTHEANQVEIGKRIYGGDWGANNLGNIAPLDGWTYRGGGMDHCTGRRNYKLVDLDLGLHGALVANPDLILDTTVAAKALVTGMQTGRYTGVKLKLPDQRLVREDFVPCRRVINGVDRADDIAGYAMKFQAALVTGGWA